MGEKNSELPSKLVYFGTLPCTCFENTVVSNRSIIMNIRDPQDTSLIKLQISFKHVNFIRMVRNQLKRALILHVNAHCAKRIRNMFSSGAEAVRQYFIPESEDWSKKFVMVDVGDSNGSELEALQAILTVAANEKASSRQAVALNGTSVFFSCTSDNVFGSLIKRLLNKEDDDDVKPSTSKKENGTVPQEQNNISVGRVTNTTIILPAEKCFMAKKRPNAGAVLETNPKKPCGDGSGPSLTVIHKTAQESPGNVDNKLFMDSSTFTTRSSLLWDPSSKVQVFQTNQSQQIPSEVGNSSSVVSASAVHPSLITQRKIGSTNVISSPGNIKRLVTIDFGCGSCVKVSGKVASPTRTTADCIKSPGPALLNPQKQVQVLHSHKLFTVIADKPTPKDSRSALAKKHPVDIGSPHLVTPNMGKPELIKERQRLRSAQHKVLLQYPLEGDPEAIKITAKDVDALQPGELINDNIVSFYLKYIRQELVPRNRRDSFFFFDTFFYSSLTKGVRTAKDRFKQLAENYETVRRRTRKVDLFSKDYIVVPICEAQHWYVAVITFPRAGISKLNQVKLENPKRSAEDLLQCSDYSPLPKGVGKAHIVIMDSFIDYNETKCFLVMGSLLKYLEHEYNAKRKITSQNEYFDRRRFDMLCPRGIPQQTNLYDCGIFMLKFLEYFLVRPPEFLRKSGTFLRWYPKFSVSNTRENILKHLKELCSKDKWDAYLEYRRKDDYYTDLIGDRTPLSPPPVPEPEPLRRTVSESDLDPEVLLPLEQKPRRRNSSVF